MTELEGKCKLCGNTGPLMESHIIPRAFFRDVAAGGETPAEYSFVPGVPLKRSPTGPYDADMLCEACERMFGKWDDYGVKFLRRPLGEFKLVQGRTREGVEQDGTGILRTADVDYRRLKLFLLSVLWRAHSSGNKMFERVRLGPFEARLRAMLLARDPGEKTDFPVWLMRFHSERAPTVIQPFRGEMQGVMGYTFHFGMHDVMFAVDHRVPVGAEYTLLALEPLDGVRLMYVPLVWTRFEKGKRPIRTTGSLRFRSAGQGPAYDEHWSTTDTALVSRLPPWAKALPDL